MSPLNRRLNRTLYSNIDRFPRYEITFGLENDFEQLKQPLGRQTEITNNRFESIVHELKKKSYDFFLDLANKGLSV